METLKSGDTLGPYQLVEQLAEGGSGIVWKALVLREPDDIGTTARYIAIKVYKRKIAPEELEHEVNRWERVRGHPNILPLLQAKFFLLNNDPATLVPALVSPLAEAMLTDCAGKVTWQEALTLIEGVLQGLAHMHRAHPPLVHRDLKPGNIAVIDGVPMVMDFGISREQEQTVMETIPVGTPHYMAPEIFDGQRSLQGDIWATGVILQELLCGALPFTGSTVHEVIHRILSQPAPPLPTTVPAHIRATVQKALAKDPAARYASAEEMLQALRGQQAPAVKAPRRGITLAVAAAAIIPTLALLSLRPWASAPAPGQPPRASAPAGLAPAEQAKVALREGEQLSEEQRWTEALQKARHAIARDEKLQAAHRLIGACLLALEQYEGAAAAYQRACTLAPQDTEAQLGLATAMDALGEVAEARRLYRELVGSSRSSPLEKQQARERLKQLR